LRRSIILSQIWGRGKKKKRRGYKSNHISARKGGKNKKGLSIDKERGEVQFHGSPPYPSSPRKRKKRGAEISGTLLLRGGEGKTKGDK